MQYELIKVQDHFLLARGGGGGSSSGGGGGGSSSSSSSSSSRSYSSGSSGSAGSEPWWVGLLVFGIIAFFMIGFIVLILKFGKTVAGTAAVPAGFIDPNKDAKATEQEKKLASDAKETFLAFQKSWSEFDLVKMKRITSPEYYKKMALHLGVLQNYQRQNLMENVKILSTFIQRNEKYDAGFAVFFAASARDKILDQKDNKVIYTDNSVFSEIWHFVKSGKEYVLDKIDQTTADASKFDTGIAEFASKNNFYYDPDFGWLMMPSRGAIFGPAGFGNADINNHVVGYYGTGAKAKIVEFYSYEPKAGAGLSPITVAQAILPKSYDDILVTEKSWYNFKPKLKGLNKIETESVEFNKKFSVWAANQDQATSFELLATNFMERIYALEFEVNIEVVDNVLYLYSPGTNINYADMLEVLSWAFDEMKM